MMTVHFTSGGSRLSVDLEVLYIRLVFIMEYIFFLIVRFNTKPSVPWAPPPVICATCVMYGVRTLPSRRYELLDQLGSGASGTVWKCRLAHGQPGGRPGGAPGDEPLPGVIYAAKIIDLRPFKLRERFSMQRYLGFNRSTVLWRDDVSAIVMQRLTGVDVWIGMKRNIWIDSLLFVSTQPLDDGTCIYIYISTLQICCTSRGMDNNSRKRVSFIYRDG